MIEVKTQEIKRYPEKISVSDIKEIDFNKIAKKEYQSNIKEFQKEDVPQYTSAEKGTIVHKILKHLNYLNINDMNSLEKEIKKIVDKKIIIESEYKCLDRNKILNFCNSDIVHRMKKATKIYKEMPFVLKKSVREIFKDENIKKDDTILIQGIIDCYFEEDGNIILLDYKTDWTEDITGEYLKNKYNSQMKLYKEALNKALKREVKEIIIYSVHLNKEFYI
jgi:ATP-dependent helicase/nuclease subunit A